MYPSLSLDPARAAWIEKTANDIAQLAQKHRSQLDQANIENNFPQDVYRALGEMGYVGPLVPKDLGGSGWGVPEYVVINEEIGRQAMVQSQVAVQGQKWILDWGTTEQKNKWLAAICRGEKVFAESISEPGMGSSFKNMSATAKRDADGWILNGHKTHVNMGADCDVTLFYAVAEEGLTSFLVDMSLPGISTKVTAAIGSRLIRTADVIFENVRVTNSDLLGTPGGGLDTFLSTFNVSRLGNASELIGLGRRALEIAVNYGSERIVGSNHVTEFQGIQWMISESWTALQSASLARDYAALLSETGADLALATTVAKSEAIHAAETAIDTAFSIMGGAALYEDSPLVPIANEIKVLKVAGGSAEIMRNFIARSVLKDPKHQGLA